ncbi:MAG: transposase, partial [Megasphaera elsdenii]|nr:transposase [Megasphaera elsdenii]
MSNLTKTIKLRIHVTPEQETLFRQMTEQYRQACNFVSQYIFDHRFNMTYQSLNKELYRDLRSQFGLKSQLAQSSIKTTIARYKTVKQQLFQNHYRYKDENGNWQRIAKTLEWLWKPIFFTRPQADLVRNRDYSFVDDGQILSINTLGKRTKCTFEGEHFAEYLDGAYDLGTAKLVELKGLWYLHIPVTQAVEDFQKENVRHV